ncbi:MAG: SEL1-like repeat protein, partial [Elusimicrobia bacterium]|nr:SEL1-like repeat protein [Elusimicrobiota bacterium]
KDEPAGYALLVEAANAGVADAAFEAAQCLRLGRGVTPDAKLAYGFYRVAAQAGHAQAAFSAALLLGQGVLGQPEPEKAAELYGIAAAAGHAAAAHNLGVMFARGVGRAPDAAAARDWMTRAVNLGFDQALFSLGLLVLLGGPGLEPDPVEALKWALLSQRRDPGGPGGKLAERVTPSLDENGRAEARRRAEAWTPKV